MWGRLVNCDVVDTYVEISGCIVIVDGGCARNGVTTLRDVQRERFVRFVGGVVDDRRADEEGRATSRGCIECAGVIDPVAAVVERVLEPWGCPKFCV
jgi:hypothetical protein